MRRNRAQANVLAESGRLIALSPHLDDAVFSIGAALSGARAAGADVRILTVFAGDPDSLAAPGWWDGKAGFRSAGEAARARREEDQRACALIGAAPIWLPFPDHQYARDLPDVWETLEPILASADLLLIPGFPLKHSDHAWLNALILDHRALLPPIGLYAEQPYAEAVWHRSGDLPECAASSSVGSNAHSPFAWFRIRPTLDNWWRKQRAFHAYGSQLRSMGRPSVRVPLRVARYERSTGGEGLAFRTDDDGLTALSRRTTTARRVEP